MEFLEGETLGARLAKGRLPMELVLRYGAEIAEGLEQAHRMGVVHRDLKPGNIMITRTGAKLLDFGLAKTAQPVMPQSSGLSATMTSANYSQPLTAEGTVMGTYQYMSPEQIEGKEADARSDIFSFGAVLYEMATGRRAFEGKSQVTVASAILEKDPEPVSMHQPLAPPSLQHVIQGALMKDPDSRWQSAADVARQLRWISSVDSTSGAQRIALPHPRWRERAWWSAAHGRAACPGRVVCVLLAPTPAGGSGIHHAAARCRLRFRRRLFRSARALARWHTRRLRGPHGEGRELDLGAPAR